MIYSHRINRVKLCFLQLEEENPCALPRAEGGPGVTCFAAVESFYHNAETKKCEMFYWGGCGGNANRFATKEECEAKCVTKN